MESCGREWSSQAGGCQGAGLRQITALISPMRILPIGYWPQHEKAHNLRDRSLEVIRMARSLAKRRGAPRSWNSRRIRGARLLTLGIVYEQHRGLPAALQPVPEEGRPVQRTYVDCESAGTRRLRARLLEIDAQVKKTIAALTARGFKSPYLRNYVWRASIRTLHDMKKTGASSMRSGRRSCVWPLPPRASTLRRFPTRIWPGSPWARRLSTHAPVSAPMAQRQIQPLGHPMRSGTPGDVLAVGTDALDQRQIARAAGGFVAT